MPRSGPSVWEATNDPIATVDADGVALAAIQGLYEVVQEQMREIEALKARLAGVEERTH